MRGEAAEQRQRRFKDNSKSFLPGLGTRKLPHDYKLFIHLNNQFIILFWSILFCSLIGASRLECFGMWSEWISMESWERRGFVEFVCKVTTFNEKGDISICTVPWLLCSFVDIFAQCYAALFLLFSTWIYFYLILMLSFLLCSEWSIFMCDFLSSNFHFISLYLS